MFLALTAAFWGCQAQSQVPVTEALVAKVVDGDTVTLANGQKVRLLGIDAPELGHEGQPADFLAHKAKGVLTDLAQGRRVRLEYDNLRYDRYGRTLAFLFLPDGTNLSRELVRQGLAHVYTVPPNMLFRDELVAAQQEAIKTRRGIWLKALNQDEPFYLGNKRSFIFHRPSCPQGETTAKSNRLHFKAIIDAYREGFRPCSTCRP
ncbi:MAG: thermonuclease family protein [Syntrophobacterales bacterium]|jgi:micrococcal nuclease